MSVLVIARKTLRDIRGPSIATGAVVLLMAAFLVALYPEYSEAFESVELPDFYSGLIGEGLDITSPVGFISGEFFSWIPLLVITIAIIGGTGATASEESNGTLDLLLAQPVSRRRIILEKAAGITVAIVLMCLAGLPGFFVTALFVDFDVGAGVVIAATVTMIPLSLIYLTLSMWAAAAAPNRSAAVVLVVGVLVVAYVMHSLGATIQWLQTPRKLQPFYWADFPGVLQEGMQWGSFLGMTALSAVFLAGAVWSFQRRDIASGAREWNLRHGLMARLPFAGPAAPTPGEEPGP